MVRLGEHLTLDPIRSEHAEALAALIDESRAELTPWLSWTERSRDVSDVRSFIATIESRRLRNQGQCYVLVADGTTAGAIDLHDSDLSNGVGAIGYWLGSRFTGRGLMTRAVGALTEIAFADYGIHRLEIYCAVANLASRRVAERAGFTLETILRGRLLTPHGLSDAALYVRFAPANEPS